MGLRPLPANTSCVRAERMIIFVYLESYAIFVFMVMEY